MDGSADQKERLGRMYHSNEVSPERYKRVLPGLDDQDAVGYQQKSMPCEVAYSNQQCFGEKEFALYDHVSYSAKALMKAAVLSSWRQRA